MTDTRAVFLECLDPVASMLTEPAILAAWDAPSALERMTVGDIVGHLVRTGNRAWDYLPDRVDGKPAIETVAGYYEAISLGTDLDSAGNSGVRDRAAAAAAAGPSALANELADARAALEAAFVDLPRAAAIRVIGGLAIRYDAYLATRIIEVVVHLDDVAASVPGFTPDVSPAAWDIAIDGSIELARVRHGDAEVLRVMARGERARADVFPVF
jgi:hypothetical protein